MSGLIYKYCPPNRFTLENLKTRSLYCRHAHEFNDPFEFWACVREGLPELQDDDARFRAAVAAWGFPDTIADDLPSDQATLKEYFGGLADGAPLMDLIYDRARITCFSSDPENLLMWSHYADGLRGCCLGFDSQEVVQECESHFLTNVQYLDSPPVIDTLVYAVVEDLFHYAVEHGYEEYEGESFRHQLNSMMSLALATKPRAWSYEQEHRLIVHTDLGIQGPVLHEYEPPALRCLIVGEKMDNSFQDTLKSALDESDIQVPIQEAVRTRDRYTLSLRDKAL